MNRKIRIYVNFLLDNDPSPFCDYIICKELLKLDEKTVRDSYEWAKRFRLYTEISDEQLPDGSWVGGFEDAITALSKGKIYKATGRAINRMVDLSLDISDPMVARAAELCKKYLTGELVPLDVQKCPPSNKAKPEIVRRAIYRSLSYFLPDDSLVAQFRNELAEHFKKSCIGGRFDYEAWRQTDICDIIGDFSYEIVDMLSYGKIPGGNAISDREQRMLLSYEWKEHIQFGNVKLSIPLPPDDPQFIFWLRALERLRDFSLYSEFMADKAAPYLYSLCERLAETDGELPIFVNKYFGKIGQYSEFWNNMRNKKKDLLLRIIRILNKCDVHTRL